MLCERESTKVIDAWLKKGVIALFQSLSPIHRSSRTVTSWITSRPRMKRRCAGHPPPLYCLHRIRNLKPLRDSCFHSLNGYAHLLNDEHMVSLQSYSRKPQLRALWKHQSECITRTRSQLPCKRFEN